MPPLSRSIDIGPLTGASQGATKAESDEAAVDPGRGTARAIHSAGKTTVGVKRGFLR
jgi:hypothetical protein